MELAYAICCCMCIWGGGGGTDRKEQAVASMLCFWRHLDMLGETDLKSDAEELSCLQIVLMEVLNAAGLYSWNTAQVLFSSFYMSTRSSQRKIPYPKPSTLLTKSQCGEHSCPSLFTSVGQWEMWRNWVW